MSRTGSIAHGDGSRPRGGAWITLSLYHPIMAPTAWS